MRTHLLETQKCVSLQGTQQQLMSAPAILCQTSYLTSNAISWSTIQILLPRMPRSPTYLFHLMGSTWNRRPCEKHTKWVWNLRVSTAAAPASSPRHLPSPHLPCLKSPFLRFTFFRPIPRWKKKKFPLQQQCLYSKEQWTVFLFFVSMICCFWCLLHIHTVKHNVF